MKHPTLFLVAITLCANAALAQQVTLSGGTLYTEWPDDLDTMPCAITIASEPADDKRTPCQIVFVVDASAGIDGAAMRAASNAVAAAAGNCGESDYFGIVAYAQHASVLFPLRPLGPSGRAEATGTIDRQATMESGRNLEIGLIEAAHMFDAIRNLDQSGRIVVVCTNGNPDRGRTDDALIAFADSLAAAADFRIITVGYGRRFDPDILIPLGELTGGSAFQVEEDDPSGISLLGREISKQTTVRGINAEIRLTLPDGCAIAGVHGATQHDGTLSLAALPNGDTARIIFGIFPRPESRREIEAELSFTNPAWNTVESQRTLIDFPIAGGSGALNPLTGPLLTLTGILGDLADRTDEMIAGRRSFAIEFTDTLKEIDNTNLRSGNLLEAILPTLRTLESDIGNTAIDSDIIALRMRYAYLRALYGY